MPLLQGRWNKRDTCGGSFWTIVWDELIFWLRFLAHPCKGGGRGRFILALVFVLSGCNQYKKLIGQDSDAISSNYLNVSGLWAGTVNVNGLEQQIRLSLSNESFDVVIGSGTIDTVFSGPITGNVAASSVVLTLFHCTDKFSIRGNVEGGVMTVGIFGIGLGSGGPACYVGTIDDDQIILIKGN